MPKKVHGLNNLDGITMKDTLTTSNLVVVMILSFVWSFWAHQIKNETKEVVSRDHIVWAWPQHGHLQEIKVKWKYADIVYIKLFSNRQLNVNQIYIQNK